MSDEDNDNKARTAPQQPLRQVSHACRQVDGCTGGNGGGGDAGGKGLSSRQWGTREPLIHRLAERPVLAVCSILCVSRELFSCLVVDVVVSIVIVIIIVVGGSLSLALLSCDSDASEMTPKRYAERYESGQR